MNMSANKFSLAESEPDRPGRSSNRVLICSALLEKEPAKGEIQIFKSRH
jgi:hypothetical protein